VRQIVLLLISRIEELEGHCKEIKDLKEQPYEKITRNSENSHSPPSADPIDFQSRRKKKPKGKKRGGQPGHPSHSCPLYPVEACERVSDYYPESGKGCGETLKGFDPNPYRHQVVGIPPISLHIEEHRLHQLTSEKCGQETRAVLPETVEACGYGERVVAVVSVLNGMYRHSHRMVGSALSDLFGLRMSLGTVNRLRKEASSAVSAPVEEAKAYVQSAPIVGADDHVASSLTVKFTLRGHSTTHTFAEKIR
jgi:transposase